MALAGRRWRTLVSAILVVLVAVSAPLAIVATWAHDEIADTETYVDTVGPLAAEPEIQAAVSDRVTDEIVTRVDLRRVTSGRFNGLVGSTQESLERFVATSVDSVVRSGAFEEAWVEANRAAHTRVVAVLTGEGTRDIDVSRGEVRLNLAEVVEQVRTRLIDDGFTLARRIPEVDVSITIFSSSDIDSAQEAFRWLERAAWMLPVLAVVAAVGAVAVARVRRRALLAVGLALVVGMVALAITLRLLRGQYLDELPAGVPNDVAELVFDAVVAYIRTAVRVVGLAGAGLALVGLLARPVARLRTRSSSTP